MAKKGNKGKWDMEPQKSSAAQYLTYIASHGISDEKFEIRYEDENIWMSQKMLAAVYGVEVPNIAYHLRKLFADGEIDKDLVIKEIFITAPDGKNYRVNHYNLQVIIALGFKIDNDRAVAFRKWANESEVKLREGNTLRALRTRREARRFTRRTQRTRREEPMLERESLRLLRPLREERVFALRTWREVKDGD